MPLRRKPRRQESALYLHLLADSDIHLPVFRSADLHRRTTTATSGLRWNHRRSKRAIAWFHQVSLSAHMAHTYSCVPFLDHPC